MPDVLEQIEREIRDRRLLRSRQKILVAVSGGVDSMVLVHALLTLRKKLGWDISVAHFNHHLRSAASREDATFVRGFAERQALPFFYGEARVKDLARMSGRSLEMVARQVRHDFLAATAKTHGISTVALAHHADDQVELFFLRLLRGTGGEGVAGMKWQSPSPSDSRITLVRPLLGLSKEELVSLAREKNISFREDASNRSLEIPRNRIRHALLPALRKYYQPELNQVVLRFMEITGEEASLVGDLANQWRKDLKPAFGKLPAAVQRRVVQFQLNQRHLRADFDQIERLRLEAGTPVNLPGNVLVKREKNGRLILSTVQPIQFDDNELPIHLTGTGGREQFSGVAVKWDIVSKRAAVNLKQRKNAESFDADAVGNKVILRHWRSGDRFQPLGLKAPVKLQDLFVNAKIPRAERHKKLVAATADGRIFWVEGLRLGEPAKVTARTRRILNWRWQGTGVE